MLLDVAVTLAVDLISWVVYTALLWLMIKLQKLNYNFLGLLGSSALAVALTHVPVAGCYLSWAVLVLCLWKCTGADIVPDVLFTVGVAGALMFAINLWVFAALIVSLSSNPTIRAALGCPEAAMEEFEQELADEEQSDSEQATASESREPSAPSPIPAKIKAAETVKPAETILEAPASHSFSVKGMSVRPSGALAMIAEGARLYTVTTGEVFTASNNAKFRCDEISAGGVILSTEKGARIKITVK